MERNHFNHGEKTISVRDLKRLREKAYKNSNASNFQISLMISIYDDMEAQDLYAANNLSIAVSQKES